MNYYIYAKLDDDFTAFTNIIDFLKLEESKLFLVTESRRAFREYENIKNINNNIIYIVKSLNSLGLNDADIATQLSWFIDNSVVLIICEIKPTYEFGFSQPTNKAVLSTILQSILSNNKNIIETSFKKNNVGRTKLPFPDNWDELYCKWSNNEITSKEFIALSGLKKATFYNLLTEYKKNQMLSTQYLKKYKIS